MKYSFIKVRAKSSISPELQLVLYFFGVTLFLLFFTYFVLLYKNYSFDSEIIEIDNSSLTYKQNGEKMRDQIAFIKKESSRAQGIHTSNVVLQESIKNLFDLIPERIVLSRVEMQENSLILYGITPSKEIYEFMLHAPLRSIFHRTYSSFYPYENGWYKFVSTNYLDRTAQESVELNEGVIDENE